MKASLLLLLIGPPLAAPLAAQQGAVERWSLQIRGESLVDRGELRFDAEGARLLLESRDSAWQPLDSLIRSGDQIQFVIGGSRRFTGTAQQGAMRGTLSDGGRDVAAWEAQWIQTGAERWPVRPRVRVRQLIIGRSDTLARFPGPLVQRLRSHEQQMAEYVALSEAAGMAPREAATFASRSQHTMLGLDDAGRAAAQRMLVAIAATPAADRQFRNLFTGKHGAWRLDLHDAAWEFALEARSDKPIDLDALIGVLARLGVPADSATVRAAVWRLWGSNRGATERAALRAAGVATGLPAAADLQVLLASYDSAAEWWSVAVRWLMEARWIAAPSGWQSPVSLMRAFWQDSTLTLPALELHHFGSVQAAPVVPAGPLVSLLLVGENAIAREWLAAPRRRHELLAAWRELDLIDVPPLSVATAGRALPVASAAQQTRSRIGGFLSETAAIRIEPAILPIFAIGTVVHEWQHLLFEAERSVPSSPRAWRESPWGVVLIEADPWLGEGAAEWATEMTFAPVRGAVPLLSLAELEKRLTIAATSPDDPHVLGYLLVRAAADHLGDPPRMRRLLAEHLDDPTALGAAVGLGGPPYRSVARPSTLMLIPEITFTYDAGLADAARRRVVIPAAAGEP